MVKFWRFWGSRKGVKSWMGWDDLEVGCERLVSRVGSMEEKEDKHRRGYCGTGETEGGGNGDLAPSGGIPP